MELQMLAQNIRRLRAAKGMSQGALAERVGLSLSAMRELEIARSEPQMRTVQAIAQVLKVGLHELFQPVRELHAVRFRATKKMRNRADILVEVVRRLDDFNFLEDVLDEKIPFRLNARRKRCPKEELPEAARLCRKELGLTSSDPIYDICGLLEEAGVKLLPLHVEVEKFFGLSVGEEDGGPAVIVNVYERIPVERRIFSAAHELGHLLLHLDAYDIDKRDEDEVEEAEADRFAEHFLMPDEGFCKEWNDAAGLHFVDRVLKVKRIFRVSYKAVLSRLVEKGAADDSIWARFNVGYQRRFNQKLAFKEEPMTLEASEPFGMNKIDFVEDRFMRLTRKAVEEDKISLSRGAEILRLSVEEMRNLAQNWEPVL